TESPYRPAATGSHPLDPAPAGARPAVRSRGPLEAGRRTARAFQGKLDPETRPPSHYRAVTALARSAGDAQANPACDAARPIAPWIASHQLLCRYPAGTTGSPLFRYL